jgi:hypothetical protein
LDPVFTAVVTEMPHHKSYVATMESTGAGLVENDPKKEVALLIFTWMQDRAITDLLFKIYAEVLTSQIKE